VTALNSRITGQSDRNYRARGSKVWWWMERELGASRKGGLFYSLLRTGEGGQWLCLPIGQNFGKGGESGLSASCNPGRNTSSYMYVHISGRRGERLCLYIHLYNHGLLGGQPPG